MRYYFFGLVVILAACSKPTQETGSTDPTDASTTQAAQPPVDQSKLVTLTQDELNQVHLAIFLRLHQFQLFGDDGSWVAEKESYDIKGNSFTYSLVRRNQSPGFYNDLSSAQDGGGTFQDPQEWYDKATAIQEEVEEVDGESEDVPDDDGMSEEEEAELEAELDGSNYNEGYIINEYDTISGNGMFVAMNEANPENMYKTVRCRISGSIDWSNYYYSHYGQPQRQSRSYGFDDIVVELGLPVATRDQLYLKAKIMALDDADLKGMSKDDISYLRNEIFARYGHTFKTDKMKKYFEQKTWYYPGVDDAGPLLNKQEKANVEFLKKKEG